MVTVVAFLFLGEVKWSEAFDEGVFAGLFVWLISMLAYIVLHELTHGLAYKALTKEKLAFGMSWSCASCGVPDIFTYRKTTMISVLAPFVVFTVVLLPLTVWLYFVNPLAYLGSAFLLGLHLGGCSGDLFVFGLLVCKFKDKRTLVRDTGPQQYFFVPENEEDF